MIWIIKLAIALFFIVMFIRRTSFAWGIGLLTVTSAFLIDAMTVLTGRDVLIEQFGFFGYVAAGALLAGGFLWLLGLLRPLVDDSPRAIPSFRSRASQQEGPTRTGSASAPVDRQLLYDQMRDNLGPDDVLDVIFDIDINENEVINPHAPMPEVLHAVIDAAETHDRTQALGVAVERVLVPLPKENLPRLEKISADSPSAVLRQYLIANYNLAQLEQLATGLSVDFQGLGDGAKKNRVRNFLLYLKRRNQIPQLVQHLERRSLKTV